MIVPADPSAGNALTQFTSQPVAVFLVGFVITAGLVARKVKGALLIGIVASKLVDTYHKPAIVLSIEDGIAHGSCRSIPAFDLLAALEDNEQQDQQQQQKQQCGLSY